MVADFAWKIKKRKTEIHPNTKFLLNFKGRNKKTLSGSYQTSLGETRLLNLVPLLKFLFEKCFSLSCIHVFIVVVNRRSVVFIALARAALRLIRLGVVENGLTCCSILHLCMNIVWFPRCQ